ncbi:MAG: hypothetical protein WBQ23_14415 [Bacteroidota bacterium]
MKYRLLSIAVLIAAITFGGCIETQMLVTVNKDGSGTIRETVTMKKKVVESIREMSEQMKQGAEEGGLQTEEEQKPFELFSDEEIRGNGEKLGTNVRYVSHGMIDEDDVEGYSATYAFDDINTVKVNQNPGASMPDMPGTESTDETDDALVLFSFTPGSSAKLVIRPPKMKEGEPDQADEVESPETDQQQEEGEGGMEQMKDFFRDMRILVQVAVDGTITNTNASFVDGSVVTIMDVNFNSFLDDPELLKELQKIETKGPAAAKELFQSVPGIRVELEEEITVNFN